MGILRTNRVAGLGGANAIKGSVFFPHDGSATTTSGALQIQNANDALTFGTGDWTIEFWFYANRLGTAQHLYDGRGTGAGSNAAVLIQISDANKIRFFSTSAYRITGSTTITVNEWHHVALTRTGSTHTLYVNGSSDGTYSADSVDYLGPTNGFSAIGSDDNGSGAYGLNGFISNLRIAKELIYSAAFTVPTTALTPTSNTTLLCCQSPGNVEASFGGLNVNAFAANTNSKGPVASRFTPNSPVGFSTTTDVGTQFGSTFDGVTTFDSQAYMVPPGGNTRERNRGRGIIAGGCTPLTSSIDFFNIQSQGNSIKFGSLQSGAIFGNQMCASSTRGISGGGAQPTTRNYLDFITIASESDSTDFGDLTVARRDIGALSNQTRGIWAGGSDPSKKDEIDFVTIATLGDATDFGNLGGDNRSGVACSASPTRGVMGGGLVSPAEVNSIEFITISTTGNASDFGDLTRTDSSLSAVSSNTRAVFANGGVNTIDFITIASTGNATDFGDTTLARAQCSSTMSNSLRGVFAGGYLPSPTSSDTNVVDFIEIATTGNAQDFGDISRDGNDGNREGGGCSDSHGGLE